MSYNKNWLFVVNPVSGAKKSKSDWHIIEQKLREKEIRFDTHFTQFKGEAISIVKNYLRNGVRTIVVVGGDGTLNEVVNGVINQNECNPDEINIGIIPTGSGNDWCRMFNIPFDYDKAVDILKTQKTTLHDVGYVTFNESQSKRYFLNVAGLGFDAAVINKTTLNKDYSSKYKTSYLLTLFSSLVSYKKEVAAIDVDQTKIRDKIFSMNVGICRYSGGGMMQVPDAIHDDNLLDVTIIKNISKTAVVRNIKKLYDGSFINHPKVETIRGQKITINSTEKFLLEVDGEILGKGPFEFGILHKHIRLIIA